MVESAILLEEMGRAACPGPYFPTVLAARAIEEAGSDAQKKRWLSPIATGDARATIAEREAEHACDPQAREQRVCRTLRDRRNSGLRGRGSGYRRGGSRRSR